MGSLLKVISSGSVLGLLDDIMNGIVQIFIAPLLWGLCDIFFIILDMFDTLYKKFAGIDELVVGDVLVDQDPVLYLINTSAVQEMFFSIMILSLILLVIFTIFAIVKNIYTEKPKPIGEILSSSAKGLLMYLLVPVATVVCLLVGNIVLRAVDGATKGESASTASDMLFMSAAYSANKLRDPDDEDKRYNLEKMIENGLLNIKDDAPEGAKQKYIRQLREANIAPDGIIDYNTVDYELAATAIDEAFLAGVIPGKDILIKSKWDLSKVSNYYSIISINLITVWAGGAFMIWAMGKITWGLISRMFKMTVFFALSPALMAMYPIDNGKALGSWRSEMVKNGTMAYCAVGTLNVVLSVLPSFSQIKLFGSWWILNKLAALFITIVALASAEKMISTVGGWFGTGDALAEGKATASAVKSAVKKPGEIANKHRDKALGYFGGIRGGIKAAEKQDRNRFLGALTGAFSQTNAAKTYQEIQKKHQDGVKGGGDLYKNFRTKESGILGILGEEDKARLAEYEANEDRAKKRKQYEALTGRRGAALATYYSRGADTGRDPNMLRTREWLNNASDAGKAVYEAAYNTNKIAQERNKEQQEFVGAVNAIAKSQSERLTSEGSLQAEFDRILGTGRWAGATDTQREALMNQIISNPTAHGMQNADVLIGLKTKYETASKAFNDAMTAHNNKLSDNTDYRNYINTTEGRSLLADAQSTNAANLANVQNQLNSVVRTGHAITRAKTQLDKLSAEVAQRDLTGNLTQTERAAVANYRRTHPKN